MVGGGKDREEMRLIDADALIKEYPQASGLKLVIENAPTAFDTEKVVEQLESEKIIHYGLHTEETDIMKIDDAIDIVKKGGVE